MDFIVGCNYWASNAGTEMWRQFDENVVDEDMEILASHGVKYIRVFPLWRDFQPVKALTGWAGKVTRYCLEDESEPSNPYFLDETMLKRFETFSDICRGHGISLILGLITGAMSGGMFTPSALFGKKLISDPVAQYLQQLFIKGFVTRFKNDPAIVAWDLGNECNCMEYVTDRYQAASWLAMASNAIRSADSSRPVLSGMHSCDIKSGWTITDQAEFCDMLTTHPYPYFNEHGRVDKLLSPRTTMYPTVMNKLCADIGKKPCLMEELGTLGPAFCSDERSADFLRVTFFSLLANGSTGFMWWCANDQTMLERYPHTHVMLEVELGMIYADRRPKPILKEMKKLSALLDEKLNAPLSPAKEDGVILLTDSQDQGGIAFATHMMSRLAHLNCRFEYAEYSLPESSLYIMPSVTNAYSMPKRRFDTLKQRVFDGADLYMSLDGAILYDFEGFTGMRVEDSCVHHTRGSVTLDGKKIGFSTDRPLSLTPTTAKVLAYDDSGAPFISVNQYGKGHVYLVNGPVEKELLNTHDADIEAYAYLYRSLLGKYTDRSVVADINESLLYTVHPTDGGAYVFVINHFAEEKPLEISLADGWSAEEVLYGSPDTIAPFDACILKINKR